MKNANADQPGFPPVDACAIDEAEMENVQVEQRAGRKRDNGRKPTYDGDVGFLGQHLGHFCAAPRARRAPGCKTLPSRLYHDDGAHSSPQTLCLITQLLRARTHSVLPRASRNDARIELTAAAKIRHNRLDVTDQRAEKGW